VFLLTDYSLWYFFGLIVCIFISIERRRKRYTAEKLTEAVKQILSQIGNEYKIKFKGKVFTK